MASFYYIGNGSNLNSIPVAGGSINQLVGGVPSPAGGRLFHADGFLFWANFDELLRVEIASPGGPTVLSLGTADVKDLAVDATTAYFSDTATDAIRSVPLGGGNGSTIAAGQASPNRIAVDDDRVYLHVGEPGEIRSVPKEGGSVTTIASVPLGSLIELVVDSTHAYWVDQESVWRAPK